MVRSETYRTKKYEAKMDDTSIAQRFRDQKTDMVDQMSARSAELVLVEMKAKKIIEAAGIAVILVAQYLNFARQCYRLARQFSQATQINEVYYRYQYWVSQGLTPAILTDIAALCGIDLTDYPA